MTFDATRTSELPWMQTHICQEEQLGCTGEFSCYQPDLVGSGSGSYIGIELLVSLRAKNSKKYPQKASQYCSYCSPALHVLCRDSGHGTLSPPPAALQPLFTFAYQDPVLIQDARVFRNMLEIEEFYLAASNYFQVHT